ncbi:hypothetical protein [Streptomyces sp. NPDC088757]|uniref:hypothetical protein n=1 Tax=Streptomyces sp. NPDC088757 TaxID=3365889 RepID=UPI00381D5E66
MLRHAIAPVRSFTKASNELVRHAHLNSDAKILLLHVQGLPESACDKSLGEHAADLGLRPREYQRAKKLLTAGGFLHEWKVQKRDGRWSTHQVLSNITLTREEASAVRSGAPARKAGDPEGPGGANPTVGPPTSPELGRSNPKDEDWGKTSSHPPTEEPVEEPAAEASAVEEPAAEVPAAEAPAPEVATAERLLLSLRHQSRDLLLGVREARGLAEAAAEWLRRGVSVAELRHALTSHLPVDGVRSAVGFLRHRLTVKLPERPSAPAVAAPAGGGIVICEGPGKEHTFRQVADETRCGPCRRERARTRTEPVGGPVSWRDHFDKVARGLVT